MTDPYADDAERARRLSQPFARWITQLRAVALRYLWFARLYKAVVTLLGAVVVIVGLILVPLPGPGWLIVFLGLTILGTEYHWARRLLGWLRTRLARFWERWHTWRAASRQRRARGGAENSSAGETQQRKIQQRAGSTEV